MHEVTIFQFNSQEVRVLIDETGEPLWVAKDVCDVLGYSNPARTVRDHCREGGIRKRYTPSSSGDQEMVCIDEGNLYRLIIKSTKKESEPFEAWVCDEVLPAIRKTGSYSTTCELPIKILEGEVKEGAALLSQVIGRVELPEQQKWQLLDRLFTELFGIGVEILDYPPKKLEMLQEQCRDHWNCAGRSSRREAPLLVIVNHKGYDDYRVRLADNILLYFINEYCVEDRKAGASQQTLYKLFSRWFEEATCHPAPTFEVFHDAMAERHLPISLAGEPWFVGIAPKEVAA